MKLSVFNNIAIGFFFNQFVPICKVEILRKNISIVIGNLKCYITSVKSSNYKLKSQPLQSSMLQHYQHLNYIKINEDIDHITIDVPPIHEALNVFFLLHLFWLGSRQLYNTKNKNLG